MRKVFSWLAITLVISALTTAAVANYVQNHPTSLLAQGFARVAALCTAAPTAARLPATLQPNIVSMDGTPLPDAIIDLSPELKRACSFDVNELRAISELGQQNTPRVVCAVPEDEFTYPTLPPAREEVLAEGEIIEGYPTPMDTEEPVAEQLPMPRAFDVAFDFTLRDTPSAELDFTLPMPPCGTAPCVGVFNFVQHMVDSCVKCLSDGCCCEKAKGCKEGAQCPPCQIRYRTGDDGLERVSIDFDCKENPKQACDDCQLDLKNVLILVGNTDGVQGMVGMQPVYVQRVPCADGPCPNCPLGCQPLCAPCCQQAQLVRKVYPVGCFIDPSQNATEEDVVRVICRTVAPQSWDVVGGSGVIDYFPLGKSLVVLQTEAVHSEIDKLLSELRATMSSQPVAQTTPQPVQFATFVNEQAVQPACCEKGKCCEQACCKNGTITIEVDGAKVIIDTINTPNSWSLKLRPKDVYRPWYECGCDVEFVPYVPSDGAPPCSEFEAVLQRLGDYTGGLLIQLDPTTPEGLPVFVEPVAGRYHDQHQVYAHAGHCTRSGEIWRDKVLVYEPGIDIGFQFAEPTYDTLADRALWQLVMEFQQAEGTGEFDGLNDG
jgi:hypothetical protein